MSAAVDRARATIRAKGRAVTLVQYNQTAANGAKPWDGPASPTATPVLTVATYAAFVGVGSGPSLGFAKQPEDLVKRAAASMIIAGEDPADLSHVDEITDAFRTWKVIDCQVLQPALERILYYFTVAK
jgi:hypothetical protein